MTKEDRNRADARFNKANLASPARAIAMSHQAVLDNMARLKALRLAREASEPPPRPWSRNRAPSQRSG